MNDAGAIGSSPWSDAALAASLLAVDPAGTGGAMLRSLPGPVRDRWLALLRDSLPAGAPFRRVPLHVSDARLLGGLDLAATLASGRPVAERGILADADGGVLLLAMAERVESAAAARLHQVLDIGQLLLERDGLVARSPSHFGVVALDEGMSPDERPPAALSDRLAFHLDLGAVAVREAAGPVPDREEIAAARHRLPSVGVDAEIIHALCATAMALGIDSLRAPLLALRVARAAAALAGGSVVSLADAEAAARLVLAPRATTIPAPAPDQSPPADAPPPALDADGNEGPDESDREHTTDPDSMPDRMIGAATAAIPAGLLAQLGAGAAARSRRSESGGASARRISFRRGRRIGVQRGDPRSGARLSIVETLRAAAPWQPLRRARTHTAKSDGRPARIVVRRDDFRVFRFTQPREATAIFVVDASGSTALERLAEAKGAVELLLAECYVRRDKVALFAFRGRTADLLLPPTRSLVRAKRSLAGIPGGGGTPLAAAIDAATHLCDAVMRRGGTPLVVFLTDGRANVARDGRGGRAPGEADAFEAARSLRAASIRALVVDTSSRPQGAADRLAREMGATFLPLPHADSAALCETVRAAGVGTARGIVAR